MHSFGLPRPTGKAAIENHSIKRNYMTVAEEILKPKKGGIFRTVFLYTGQGETTLLIIPTGSGADDYIYVLLDSDLDKDPKEVNLIKLFEDLFATSGELSVFINTHPHDDHLGGIKEIYKKIGFKEVWHSRSSSGPLPGYQAALPYTPHSEKKWTKWIG